MPYPRWLAKVNKRVFNPGQIRRAGRPIVTHLGRSSGAVYQTPLDAFPTRSGYVLVVRYGPDSDWVRNILSAGEATLRINGEDHLLISPRLVALSEALDQLMSPEPPKDFTRAEDFLLMEHPAE